MDSQNSIPAFRSGGYLPEGLFVASLAEVTFRFGSSNRHRRRLTLRVRRWHELALKVNAPRLFLDGSFVTAKTTPNDVDAVILLPPDFSSQVASECESAIELEEMLLTRQPNELFGAEDETDWNDWIEFFSRTRESDGRRKGLVEVTL